MQQLLRRRNTRVVLAGMLFSAFLFSFLPSCKKEEKEERVLSTRDNLLGTWRRSIRGWDTNHNGILDSSEEYHAPATDTLTLTLVPDATYSRILRFKGAEFPETGTWHLQGGDKDMVLQPSTSTSKVDTFRLDTVSQYYFMYHNSEDYFESFARPQ